MQAHCRRLSLVAWAVVSAALPPTVNVSCGGVTGVWLDVPGSGRLAQFRSLPFAAPPVGSLRWRPPSPPPCWSGVYDATQYRGYCVQGVGGTEDCLYLTVRVPEAVLNGSWGAPLPVLVYIHGGGLMAGSGNWEGLDWFTVSAGGPGVVVVTVNYRLNVFGFLATAELSQEQGGASGNYGIQDQQAALRWVHANIAAFGGDPDAITVGGQSSGGTSIFALMSSPASAGLFRAAISLSGSPNITLDMRAAERQNAPIVSALGCDSGNWSAVVACLRSLTPAQLTNAVPSAWNTPGMWSVEALDVHGMNYSGVVIVDGRVVTMPFSRAMATGLHGHVALMVGNMGEENDLAPGTVVRSFSALQWESFVNQSLRSWGTDVNAGAVVSDLYSLEASINPQLAYDAFNTDYGLVCANRDITVAAKSAGAYAAPIYLFVNQWPPETPGANGIPSYAYHTWDYMAGTRQWGGYQPSPQDTALGQLLVSHWYQFIRDGALNASSGWDSVEAVDGFPSQWNTFVYARTDRFPYVQSGQAVAYRGTACATLASLGFDERYWWCD